MSGARRFNPWVWLPVGVILVAAIPNLILVVVAKRAHITKVEEQPWLAAGRLDEQASVQTAFHASGARFTAQVEGRRITAMVNGKPPPRTAPAVLLCYRSSDAALDRRLAWPDPTIPCRIELPVGGRWVLCLNTGDGLTVATYAVDLSP